MNDVCAPRLVAPGISVASQHLNVALLNLVFEEEILNAKDLSDRVIGTLLNSRKPVMRTIYFKVWKVFNSWLAWHSSVFPVSLGRGR